MSLFPTRDRVLELIESDAPDKLKAALRDNLTPAIALLLEKADNENLAVGQSKIGGAPDVPADFDWPQWKEKPLGFVAQFNFEEVAPFDLKQELPTSGLLSFFYAMEEQPWGFVKDKGAWQVFHWPRNIKVVRRELPKNIGERNFLSSHSIDFATEWQWLDSLSAPAFAEIEIDEDQEEGRWWDFYDAAKALLPETPCHQLLGYAESIQDDAPTRCAVKVHNIEYIDCEPNADFYQRMRDADADKWRLLFQFDSQTSVGENSRAKDDWIWGDAGMLYFCINDEDLKAHNFDNVWLQLQCT